MYSLLFHRARITTFHVKQQKPNSRISIQLGSLFTLHLRNLKTERSPFILEMRSMRLRQGKTKSIVTLQLIVFQKLRFRSVFCPHGNKKLEFSNSSSFRSVFKMLRLCERLVWTIGLTIETRFKFLQGSVDGV